MEVGGYMSWKPYDGSEYLDFAAVENFCRNLAAQHPEWVTLEEIGQIMGLTRERIRQIKEEAFDKIRSSKAFKYMHDYAEEPQA